MTVGVLAIRADDFEELGNPAGDQPFTDQNQHQHGAQKAQSQRPSTVPVTCDPECEPKHRANDELRFESGERKKDSREDEVIGGQEKAGKRYERGGDQA